MDKLLQRTFLFHHIKKRFNIKLTLPYSKFVAKQDKNTLIEEEINATMPALLEEIIASSENMIINIDKNYHSYRSLLVTVFLDVKNERNDEKKKQPVRWVQIKSRFLTSHFDMTRLMNF